MSKPTIAGLEAELAARDRRIGRLERELAARDRRIGHLERELAAAREVIERQGRALIKRPVGRPLGASDAQVLAVRRLRKKGLSLRAVAGAASLSLSTVRSILDRNAGQPR